MAPVNKLRIPHEALERSYLDRFINAFPALDGESITRPERHPDFLVSQPGGCCIGIEITRMFRKKLTGRDQMQAQETLRSRILASAKSAYDKARHPPAYVSVFFSRGDEITKTDVHPLIERLLAVVTANIPPMGECREILYDDFPQDALPDVFDDVSIYRCAEMAGSEWTAPDAYFQPTYGAEHVQSKLDEKNGLYASYRKHASVVWLIIVVDDSFPSSDIAVSSEALRQTYESKFDRTFLFTCSTRAINELSR
jgi:hypothetical protein